MNIRDLVNALTLDSVSRNRLGIGVSCEETCFTVTFADGEMWRVPFGKPEYVGNTDYDDPPEYWER